MSDALSQVPSFVCRKCSGLAPMYFCPVCRAEFDRRHQLWLKKQREQARARRLRKRLSTGGICTVCGKVFFGRRKDAAYCSDTCRQRHHRAKDSSSQKTGAYKSEVPDIRDNTESATNGLSRISGGYKTEPPHICDSTLDAIQTVTQETSP